MTPSTVRTPPAGTFPLVSANVSSRIVLSNYYEHFSSSPRGLAIGADAECLELVWNTSKPTPCLLVRPTYQATSHHAAVAACQFNAPAPLGVTHHTPHERGVFQEENDARPPCTVRARRPADVPHHSGADSPPLVVRASGSGSADVCSLGVHSKGTFHTNFRKHRTHRRTSGVGPAERS